MEEIKVNNNYKTNIKSKEFRPHHSMKRTAISWSTKGVRTWEENLGHWKPSCHFHLMWQAADAISSLSTFQALYF